MIEVLRTGIRGRAGKSAYELWLEDGHEGTEEDYQEWLKGQDGASAYQEWLNNGNTGSEEDFLESLKGERGAAGPAGPQGGIGPTGDPGSASGIFVPWEPPEMEPMRTDIPGYIFDGFGDYDPLRAYSQLWDSFGDQDGYITKSTLGLDQSGTYPVYLYDFNPGAYDKEIIISCNLHGGERLGQYATWFFFRHMLNNWRENSYFGYCRNNVRWLVVPNANPWGYKNNARGNINQVNLNRNSSYYWDEFVVVSPPNEDYKGTSAWSEVEASYLRDLIAQFPDAVAYADMHTFGSSGNQGHYIAYTTGGKCDGSEVLADVLALLDKGEGTKYTSCNVRRMNSPTIVNYAANSFGMVCFNPEFDPGYYSPIFSSECNTAATRYYGNVLLALASVQQKSIRVIKKAPRSGYAVWSTSSGNTIMIDNTSYAEILPFRAKLPVNGFGYVKVAGNISFQGSGALQFWVAPAGGQDFQGKCGINDAFGDKGYWQYNRRSSLDEVVMTIENNSARATLPFSCMFPVCPVMAPTTASLPGPVMIGMFARVNTGQVNITKISMLWEFVPSGYGQEVVTVQNATGRTSDGANAMTRTIPFNP